ncbi:MAG: type II toxin-antitoxin system PemK/MazF family toxin [Alphaproteobacteria bacterium]|nr:type II toxin-antitoxin system PemK/MazF family toxin [Alphaproteobacteria bacterium]
MVLMCDYQTGFVPPEMIKKRRVVVLSPKFINNRGLCTIAPISTSEPEREYPFHVKIEAGNYSFHSKRQPCWVKCDILSSVSYKRLDRIRIGNQFVAPRISHADFERIKAAAIHVVSGHIS